MSSEPMSTDASTPDGTGRARDIAPEIWATHEDLSPLSARFLRYVLAHPDAARRIDYRQAASVVDVMHRYPYVLQPWPVFVDARKQHQIERATVALTELVKSIPERIFGGDPRRIGHFYDIRNEGLVELLLAPPNGIATSWARGDFVDDGSDLKCMELNVSTTIGGWQDRFFERVCRSQPFIAPFLASEGVEVHHRDPWRTALQLVLANGCRLGHDVAGHFNIVVFVGAWVAEADRLVAFLNELFQEVLAASGTGCRGACLRCTDPQALVARDSGLFLGGRSISAVIDNHETQTPKDVYRCFKMGRIGLFNGPLTNLLANKRNLALLSEHEESDLLTAEERLVVRSNVPWSREVTDRRTTYRGESVNLLDFAVARRDCLVLKPAAGYQGIDVHIGRCTEPAEWRQRLEQATGTGRMLLQEYVTSRPYLFQHGEHGWAPHQVIWGTFSLGGIYGGGFLRLLPIDRGPGVINSARGATEALIFEV